MLDHSTLISADTGRDVVAYNINEGGNGTVNGIAPTIAVLTVPVFNIGGVFLDLPEFIVRLLTRTPSVFAVDVHLYRNGVDIAWVATATQYLISHGLLGKLQGILGTILAHLKISIGPPPVNGNGPKSLIEVNGTVSAAVHKFWGQDGIPSSLVIN